MALFKNREQPQQREIAVAKPDEPAPTFQQKVASMASAIDVLVTGDWRDADNVLTLQEALGAEMAPRHFPESSIWARSIPFSDHAASADEWLIIMKLYQLLVYWNDQALPEFRQTNPNLVEMIGWARPADRATMRDKAFEAALHLDPRQVVFASSGDSVGTILLLESIALGRTVDWLSNPAPPPPPAPSSRERIDAVIRRARQGEADAIAFEKALAATSNEESRRFLEESASLGSIDAMEAAAEMAQAAGDTQSELFWAETAASAGSVRGMSRLVAILYDAGRIPEAVGWLERAGQAGDDKAYALLAQMASEDGDQDGAKRWADVGAQAGNPECMRMKASYILNGGQFEQAVLAHAWFVDAARHGSDRAMYQLSQLTKALGHHPQAHYWLEHAATLGNPEAKEQLEGTSPVRAPDTLSAVRNSAAGTPGFTPNDEWEHATIWYGQEGDMQNPGQMMWSAQIKWPNRENLDLRDRVSIDSVLAELAQGGWELESVEPTAGISAQDYRIRRRRPLGPSQGSQLGSTST